MGSGVMDPACAAPVDRGSRDRAQAGSSLHSPALLHPQGYKFERMDGVMGAVGHALAMAGSMTWEILWALILGFALSAVVQAVVRRETSSAGRRRPPRTLAGRDRARRGARSCSYAAVALARSLFRKGANFTAAMAFEIASTNLVIELGIILALLMGWQFTLAEFVGGPIMIVVAGRAVPAVPAPPAARRGPRAGRPRAGRVDGGPRRDGHERRRRRQRSGAGCSRRDGFTSVSHVFVMEWAAVCATSSIGLLIAGRGRGLGARLVLAARSSSPTTRCGRDLGAADRAARRDDLASSARSATCRWPRCCGTAGSASAA